MSQKLFEFRELHRSPGLLVLPNVWNARSGLAYQEMDFPAIATSSAAVADSLGYADGEEMPFSAYLFVIERILSTVHIPLSVDLEMGYGHTHEEVWQNVLRLIGLGVVGINIEDSVIDGGGRRLGDAKPFAERIAYIRDRLSKECLELFINVRCDTYLLDVPAKREETGGRLKLYEDAGADGIFLPCVLTEADIRAAVQGTRLPLNVMWLPGLPGVEVLEELGVKRLTFGNSVYYQIYDKTRQWTIQG